MGLGGSSEFACPLTGGVTCENVSSVYRMSRAGTLPSKAPPPSSTAPNAGSAPTPSPSGAPVEMAPPRPAGVATAVPVATTAAGRTAVTPPMPIRSQPRILRGWIVPYEDADGDLVGDAFVFIPVDGGRWMVEHARQRIRDAYAPARPAAAAATAPSPAVQAASTSTTPASGGAKSSLLAPDGGRRPCDVHLRDKRGLDTSGARGRAPE
jgi:conjugal transfer pilus assembly protein TraV